MGNAARLPRMTAAEFLAWDTSQTVRHEFVDGEVFAMAGAEERHVVTVGNVYLALRQQLKGAPCSVLMLDMKLHVAASASYFYPDLMVTCSESDRTDTLVKREPKLIVEVLSPSTAAFDRGAKFAQYRLLPTLEEYALIDPSTRCTDVHRKGADGLWVLHPFASGEAVTLRSVALTISADDLFAAVE